MMRAEPARRAQVDDGAPALTGTARTQF